MLGATLPPPQVTSRPASLVFDAGEIYDFELTPAKAGTCNPRSDRFRVRLVSPCRSSFGRDGPSSSGTVPISYPLVELGERCYRTLVEKR